MKKVVIVIIALLAFGISARADGLNQSQIKLRDEVKSFLREEGFMPELDSDGDIIFKKEGNNYWITIVPEVKSPMLLILGTGYNNPEEFDSNTIKLASAELNFYKGVKVLCYPDSFVIESEMFLMQADQFKYAFYVLMAQIASVKGDFYSECEKAKSNTTSKSSYSSSSTSSYLSSSSSVRTINNPSYDTPSSNQGLKITKIEMTDSYTKVYCSYVNYYDSGGWCSISPDTYIKTPSGNQYKLKYAFGIPKSPQKYNFSRKYQTLEFALEFPSLPSYNYLAKISMIEPGGSSWAFYDILLK